MINSSIIEFSINFKTHSVSGETLKNRCILKQIIQWYFWVIKRKKDHCSVFCWLLEWYVFAKQSPNFSLSLQITLTLTPRTQLYCLVYCTTDDVLATLATKHHFATKISWKKSILNKFIVFCFGQSKMKKIKSNDITYIHTAYTINMTIQMDENPLLLRTFCWWSKRKTEKLNNNKYWKENWWQIQTMNNKNCELRANSQNNNNNKTLIFYDILSMWENNIKKKKCE